MVSIARWLQATRGILSKDGITMSTTPLTPTPAETFVPSYDSSPERVCIQVCRECQAICLESVAYSVRMQGYYAELGHVRLLEDAARMCEATLDFLLRGSEVRRSLTFLCAEVCERCVRDCERFDYDQRLLACAAVCRRCAEACRQMSELSIASELGPVV